MKKWSLYFLSCLFSTLFLSGQTISHDDLFIDVMAYDAIKKQCEHCIYWYYRNLDVVPHSSLFLSEQLKMQLEWFLLDDLNTAEAKKLHAKYEALNWDIPEMMKMHWSE